MVNERLRLANYSVLDRDHLRSAPGPVDLAEQGPCGGARRRGRRYALAHVERLRAIIIPAVRFSDLKRQRMRSARSYSVRAPLLQQPVSVRAATFMFVQPRLYKIHKEWPSRMVSGHVLRLPAPVPCTGNRLRSRRSREPPRKIVNILRGCGPSTRQKPVVEAQPDLLGIDNLRCTHGAALMAACLALNDATRLPKRTADRSRSLLAKCAKWAYAASWSTAIAAITLLFAPIARRCALVRYRAALRSRRTRQPRC